VSVRARVEHVGGLLRPQFLRDAREACARGELSPAGLKAAEDRAVRELVAMREEAGLPVVGDGQMRRESFQSELAAACGAFTGVDVNAWLWGAWHSSEVGDVTIARPAKLAVIAPLRNRRNLAAGRDVLRLHRGETTCAGWSATGVGSLLPKLCSITRLPSEILWHLRVAHARHNDRMQHSDATNQGCDAVMNQDPERIHDAYAPVHILPRPQCATRGGADDLDDLVAALPRDLGSPACRTPLRKHLRTRPPCNRDRAARPPRPRRILSKLQRVAHLLIPPLGAEPGAPDFPDMRRARTGH
jgi:hypothetical protein